MYLYNLIKFLEKIRIPSRELPTLKKVINTTLIFLLGVGLGIFSKWLDNLSIDDSILWQHILGILDLGNIFSMFGVWILIATSISIFSNTPLRAGINVFVFFLGMCFSYHLYTIIFAGFNPMGYMMIWYLVTLISPLMAFICWYAKGNGVIPFIINICILTVMIFCCFSIGIWYFDFNSIIETLFFVVTLFILYDTPKKSIYTLVISFIFAYIIRFFM